MEARRKGETMSQISDYLKTKLTDSFRAELLNRFGKIIVFKDLSPQDVQAVANVNLRGFTEELKERGIALEIDPSALTLLAKLGYDPSMGARPLRRVIEDKL